MVVTSVDVTSNPLNDYSEVSINLNGNNKEINELTAQLIKKGEDNKSMYFDTTEMLNKIYNKYNIDIRNQDVNKQEQEDSLPEPLYGGAFYNVDDEFIYITKVLYNNPVTVVFWSDGTKTLSRCAEGDIYNPEMGLALATLKKLTSGDFVAKLMEDWLPINGNNIKTLKDVRKEHNKK